MARGWRWRPGGAFVLGGALGLLAGRPSGADTGVGTTPMTTQAPLEDRLIRVESPAWPPRPRRPLRPVAARALHDVADDLRALLRPTAAELAGADEEYARYHETELTPRLLAADLAIDDRDVFDLGEEGELIVVGTWRDTIYCHDLWFVAGVERSSAGSYQVVMFKKLRAPVDGLHTVDLDRDGRPEVVLRTLLGMPNNGPAWHALVVSRGRGGWTCSDLASRDQLLLLERADRWVLASPDAGRTWGWRSEGFMTVGPPSVE